MAVSFTHLIVHHPYIVLITVSLLSCTFLLVPLTLRNIPDFSDPKLGFETRGTVLAQRLTAWENLHEATKESGQFAVDPREILGPPPPPPPPPSQRVKINRRKFIKKKSKKNSTGAESDDAQEVLIRTKQINSTKDLIKSRNWKSLQELSKSNVINDIELGPSHPVAHGFFCGTPDQRYSRFVLESTDERGLFNYESLMAMCHIERRLVQSKLYELNCDAVRKGLCCHPWSVANYVALLHNRTSCLAITEKDVNSSLDLLRMCSRYYHSMQLSRECSDDVLCLTSAAPGCATHDAVYNILHYLADTDFLSADDPSTVLKRSIIFLPLGCSTKTMDYYRTLEHKNLGHGNVQLVAMELGLKSALFDEYLVADAWLIMSGATCVLICMWIYTESLFLTIMTVMAIVFSLGISYFMYTLVFELHFFPFMNLLAAVVAVGIGADDAFIFCKVWQCRKLDKNNGSVARLVSDTFRHAVLSMFVTSLTTAAALYASLISSITAVCCFSAFAGTAVIANFGLMVTWLPACVIISERWCCSPALAPHWKTWSEGLRPLRNILDHLWAFLGRCLLILVLKFRHVWLVFLGLLAVASVLIVLRYPGLQLPDSPNFQLFKDSHPFEQYDLVYKHKFWFERLQKMDSSSISDNYKLPLRFVWGVLPTDNGNYMDPHSKGTLEIDESFDISHPESQMWLLNFCRELRSQPFYQSSLGPLLPNCFIESFLSWMQRRCTDPIDNIDRSPCCETQRFPYRQDIFDTCILQAMSDLYETPSEFFMPGVAGPKFSREQFPTVRAVVVEYDSNYTYSMSYNYMNGFFNQVETWMRIQLTGAPVGMKNGWFVSELEFYDLQRVLSEGTVHAIAVSMAVAFFVLLIVTLNVLISIYAIFTITCSIFTTMAVLVLLGWRLNVLESVAVSTAVGLAVDFSLHYGVNYVLCSADNDRRTAASMSLCNMGGPTAMAAVTTSLAGALMVPSSVLAYIQIGVFLIVVMLISWIYSTFLFGSLLAVVGPERGFGQFICPNFKRLSWCCSGRNNDHQDGEEPVQHDRNNKNVIRNNMLSETTLSTASTACVMVNSESHELDSLTGSRSCATGSAGPSMVRAVRPDSLSGHGDTVHNCFANNDQSPSATSDITIIMGEDG